jgi:hypothetical protein
MICSPQYGHAFVAGADVVTVVPPAAAAAAANGIAVPQALQKLTPSATARPQFVHVIGFSLSSQMNAHGAEPEHYHRTGALL